MRLGAAGGVEPAWLVPLNMDGLEAGTCKLGRGLEGVRQAVPAEAQAGGQVQQLSDHLQIDKLLWRLQPHDLLLASPPTCVSTTRT